ncbi:uncharacterized protein KY384_007980 [Bacidia gigantensis]|uniref:uncharacterized protein n=1 Tax=Bacidia gigantensis TaxID=2732470 RepID=UPI001D0520B0|nr:uncharacterized protein KY384_007980 [Bacidia gigantensis]KAG8527236.1 hypothetical protein KY384_007980 [Bacidia gigantensis]
MAEQQAVESQMERLERLLAEAQLANKDLTDAAEASRNEAQASRAEAEASRNEAQALRVQTEKTDLRTYMDAVHRHLQCNLQVEDDPASTTQGLMTRPKGRLCPSKIHRWDNLPLIQQELWNKLWTVDTDFFYDKQYDSLNTIETVGGDVGGDRISSETDLVISIKRVMQTPVAKILTKIRTNKKLSTAFHVNGEISFQNHSNGLSEEQRLETELNDFRDRSIPSSPSTPTLKASVSADDRLRASIANVNENEAKSSVHADLFYTVNVDGQRLPRLVVEYKPPHKVTVETMYAGLRDIRPFEEVINRVETLTTLKDHAELLMTAVACQTYDYMLESRLQYGFFSTGEIYVFLHIDPKDPTTLLYFPCVPKVELEDGTNWDSASTAEKDNRLHETALGRVFIFCLQALQSERLSHEWLVQAKNVVRRWEPDHQAMLDRITETLRKEKKDLDPPYKGRWARPGDDFVCPYSLRSKRVKSKPVLPSATSLNTSSFRSNGTNSDSGDDDQARPSGQGSNDYTKSPSLLIKANKSSGFNEPTGTKYGGNQRQYCTQPCILSLSKHGLLDKDCPNYFEHLYANNGLHRHAITKHQFLGLMRDQLAKDLDNDFIDLYIAGSRGATFKASLSAFGYTLIAKGTSFHWVSDLQHECKVYEHLVDFQAHSIPVCLGLISLANHYAYTAQKHLTAMMFLSYGGKPLIRNPPLHLTSPTARSKAAKRAKKAFHAMRKLGLLHTDIALRNLLWSAELNCVMFIDFERSVVFSQKKKGHQSATSMALIKRTDISPINSRSAQEMATKTAGALMPLLGIWDNYGENESQNSYKDAGVVTSIASPLASASYMDKENNANAANNMVSKLPLAMQQARRPALQPLSYNIQSRKPGELKAPSKCREPTNAPLKKAKAVQAHDGREIILKHHLNKRSYAHTTLLFKGEEALLESELKDWLDRCQKEEDASVRPPSSLTAV